MTLFLFQILVFCSEVLHTFVPEADQVAKNLEVSHFDCGAMTENTLYALNQVRQCHITHSWKIARLKSSSMLSIFGKSLTQQKVEYNLNVRSGTVDVTTTAVSTTLKLEFLVTY